MLLIFSLFGGPYGLVFRTSGVLTGPKDKGWWAWLITQVGASEAARLVWQVALRMGLRVRYIPGAQVHPQWALAVLSQVSVGIRSLAGVPD